MKNYLFVPFNDEGEQMEEFYTIKDYLPKKFRQPLIMFMARLESTYDVIISKLESDNSSFHGQYDKIKELQADVEQYKFHAETRANELVKRGAKLKELQAEIKRLNDKDGLYDEVKELQAENKRLVKQVSSNRDSNSNTHTHITREVNDYMNHHPEHSEIRLFILPIEEFSDGWCSHGVDWDDGIEV
mgnify:CR=1 FL=1|jgi:chromosome segregation ATPase|tara:strand:- start:49 stop:609 length:561 start_codon:yes stop_codon:yes gene_type:complete